MPKGIPKSGNRKKTNWVKTDQTTKALNCGHAPHVVVMNSVFPFETFDQAQKFIDLAKTMNPTGNSNYALLSHGTQVQEIKPPAKRRGRPPRNVKSQESAFTAKLNGEAYNTFKA